MCVCVCVPFLATHGMNNACGGQRTTSWTYFSLPFFCGICEMNLDQWDYIGSTFVR